MIGTTMGILGAIALVLATIGIYSLMAYDVSRRRQEIGVRMALGATRGEIVRNTIGQAGRLTGVGIVIGLVLAVAAGRGVESALFGTVALGVPLVAGITAVLVLTALVATIVPARLASKVDPATALQAR
jgi:ABC-type antimicrobial peptide transport system permease subunit